MPQGWSEHFAPDVQALVESTALILAAMTAMRTVVKLRNIRSSFFLLVAFCRKAILKDNRTMCFNMIATGLQAFLPQ